MPWFFALILILLGLLNLLKPEVSWYLSDGWKFKDAEPSDLALGLARVVGVIMIIVGLIGLLS